MAATVQIELVEMARRLLPPGRELDELVTVIRLGLKFRAQQRGRRPGYLHEYIQAVVARLAVPCTFASLIDELERDAARRALYGVKVSPVESVNRPWELVTIHEPRRGARKVPFKTIRNALTKCKKNSPPFPGSRYSGNSPL